MAKKLVFDRTGKNNSRVFLNALKDANKKGFKYVCQNERDTGLICFAIKPKKYVNDGYWGYKDSDIDRAEALPALPISWYYGGLSWIDDKPTVIKVLIKHLEEGFK